MNDDEKTIMREKEEEIIPTLKKAIEYDGPVMIDFVCENFEMVYPWVLAGKPLTEVILSNINQNVE